MKNESETETGNRSNWTWLIGGACLLVVLLALLLPRPEELPQHGVGNFDSGGTGENVKADVGLAAQNTRPISPRGGSSPAPMQTAEEIVTNKLSQFSRHRRGLVYDLARLHNVTVPVEVENFFNAVDAGRWDEMKGLFESLRQERMNETGSGKLTKLWPALTETFGVATEVEKWPAQQLLDYGNAILGSLNPGMVYVGGTDAGRFIPTLLNETSGGERHVVLTQNALADGTYLEYAAFLYRDQLNTLNQDDSGQAFKEYLADAQKRWQHDADFPDEPKQVRPGENIQKTENRVQVSGQVAVMAINERLLRMIMEKNPNTSFAIEQSLPFTSMYDGTRPLGPIMELGVQGEANVLTQESAARSAQYWRAAAEQLLADVALPDQSAARTAYSKLAAEQAALLLHHGHTVEAEQTFRIATEMAPANPDAVFRYANLLARQQRFDEAIQVVATAARTAPGQEQTFSQLMQELHRKKNH